MWCKGKKRKRKLKEIKKIRAIRDEALVCDNTGRLEKLLWGYDGVIRVDKSYGGLVSSEVMVEFITGHTYSTRDTYLSDAYRKMHELVYKIVIKKI